MAQSLDGIDLIDRVREISNRIQKRVDSVETEEATKHALVMPFIYHVLGYNVFDPAEVVPEFTADVGTKKGEKVDYAIMAAGQPVMIFECKRYGSGLSSDHASQLYRYFSVTAARFGVLTDGAIYRFFSDLSEPNKMDTKPFLEINMLDFSEADVEELRRFTKSSFDLEKILSTARDLKFIREIKLLLLSEWAEPSADFARYFATRVYPGAKTKAVIEQFQRVTRVALKQFLSDRISDRLKSALKEDSSTDDTSTDPAEPPPEAESESGIVTTEEEWQAFYVVKAIASQYVPANRVTIRDRLRYCNVLLDNNQRKRICRFFFDASPKRVGFFDADKEERVSIESVDDIFAYADRIRAAIQRIDSAKSGQHVGGTDD